MEHTGHPSVAGANWLGCHANIPRSQPPCNSLLCHDLSEPSKRSKTTEPFGLWRQTQERNRTLWPRTQTLDAVLLLIGRSQRLKKTETLPKETTKGPRPAPDHLPEEPALVTFQRGVTFWVRGLSPTFSQRSTVSQRLVACGSVASGLLRTFLSATCGTPCEKTRPTEETNR